nr:hypothetical protein EQLGYNXF_EQLGYNXF_CDS_0004 [Microvirus sp.]
MLCYWCRSVQKLTQYLLCVIERTFYETLSELRYR